MQSNKKNLIITLSAILVAAFFMPWITFFVSISAWDMLFGATSQYIDTGFKYIALAIPISGALIIYGAAFSNEKYLLPKQFLFLLPIITLVIIAVVVGAKIGNSAERMRDSDIESLIKLFGIGFWLTLIASTILPFINSKSATNTQGSSTPTLNPNQNTQQTIDQSNYTKPQASVNLPKVNWDTTFAKGKAFLSKHKVILLSSIGILIAFLIVYNLFIKADPVEDAKALAKGYCNCSEELNKNNLDSLQSFSNEFDNKKFTSRADARNSLSSVLQGNQTKYNNCTQSANLKYTERLADYNANGGQNTYIFQQTYNSICNACNNTSSSDIVTLQNQIDEKIKNIVDPEPNIEKIKSDLIGQEIIGWKFAYLNEFKSAEIINTTKSNDRIEYQIKFDLIDNTANSEEHDCEVMVVYLQNESGWYFSGVNLNYITYTNTFYPDKYVQVVPFQNCKWNAENNYKMSWKTSDWEYAGETVTGPDQGAVTLPYSTTYFIKSLEPQEIKVKFTYRPNN